MKMNEYQAWAAKTSSLRDARPTCVDPDGDTRVIPGPPLPTGVIMSRIDHGASGLSSEGGEVAEHVKHVRFHGKALDKDHLIKELGDALWYIAETATGLNITLEEVATRNVAKLQARYPEGHFTVERSENRNPEAE